MVKENDFFLLTLNYLKSSKSAKYVIVDRQSIHIQNKFKWDIDSATFVAVRELDVYEQLR